MFIQFDKSRSYRYVKSQTSKFMTEIVTYRNERLMKRLYILQSTLDKAQRILIEFPIGSGKQETTIKTGKCNNFIRICKICKLYSNHHQVIHRM